ncbi:MAG: hypothetical protein HW389_2410, partial [Bacteroidetes bacterium]|nr:hypothetical protein [Bacteroidota bacterium]
VDGWTASWTKSIGRYLVGELAESNFLEVATQGATASLGQRHCEALYFAGVVHLLNDDPTGARALFEQCVGTNRW